MSSATLLAIPALAFVTSISPGPSNIMLLVSGVNFGFRRTIPQMVGITAGFSMLLVTAGLGLGAVLRAVPALELVLKVGGGAYLLYLAWRIAMARSMAAETGSGARPLTFLESAAFQWANPKAWVVALTVMAVHADPVSPVVSSVLVAAVFALVNLPSISVWAAFGLALRRVIADPVRLRWFNIAMGSLLALSLWPMLMT
ncbi:LysE family translocator [Phreatobacter sp.]|uniref:LysE family translocator n=1 Tax=Phreatobacter sp. TaxID=1966341 RepID=UPI003F728836